eukprot:CAMPEP_0113301130 /NCGR_PEP_ID=MMETSP0010_2-20120614/2489_1 /TAXON_ID=216773 ORGANISM="Corethron hystrix, Strain 308" /NCGR_SAMPLE_ID=MMETSP0010_2 /ASSEMBLY_ACC=CAM_ASM_000155 /LENGTH=388 /DNA_ID=CAMNT_0000154705 /DNA_START=16 /DNA_END=1179 /DNA_ORIENTATION=- /assembly_acc=CAM_ASM_000155
MTAPSVTSTESASDYVEYASANYPSHTSEAIRSMGDLYTRKLWHQLGVSLLQFVTTSLPDNSAGSSPGGGTGGPGDDMAMRLYSSFILPSSSRLNQLVLARITASVAGSLSDPVAAAHLLEGALESRSRLGVGPATFLDAHLALLNLGKGVTAPVIDFLERGKTCLEKVVGEGEESVIVHSAYYRTAQAYYKVVGPPRNFYESALLYLSYTAAESMTADERYSLATDLSLAALTGEGVYNFGELVTHPILSSLRSTPNSWLLDMMLAASNGDVTKFAAVAASHEAAVSAQPALVSRADAVREKVTLLGLVDMVFRRPADDRTLKFADVAERCGVPEDRVEHMVMRALSLGLIRGSMDQVDGTVDVSWVLPRVLDHDQMKALAERFGQW